MVYFPVKHPCLYNKKIFIWYVKQKKQGRFYSREYISNFTNISEGTAFLLQGLTCKKKEGRAFRNIGKIIYTPDRKISLASFVLYFHLLLIRFFIRIQSFFFVSCSLLQKLIFDIYIFNSFSLLHSKNPSFILHQYLKKTSLSTVLQECSNNMVSDRGQKKPGPRPDRSPLGV